MTFYKGLEGPEGFPLMDRCSITGLLHAIEKRSTDGVMSVLHKILLISQSWKMICKTFCLSPRSGNGQLTSIFDVTSVDYSGGDILGVHAVKRGAVCSFALQNVGTVKRFQITMTIKQKSFY